MMMKYVVEKKYVDEVTNIQFQTFSPTYMKMGAQKLNIYLNSTQVLPTPESPISKSLNKRSSQWY